MGHGNGIDRSYRPLASESPTAMQKLSRTLLRYYRKAGFITGLGGDAIAIVADHFARVPSRSSLILVFQLGGAVSRVPRDQTAWSHREAVLYQFEVISVWQDPAEDEPNVRWA